MFSRLAKYKKTNFFILAMLLLMLALTIKNAVQPEKPQPKNVSLNELITTIEKAKADDDTIKELKLVETNRTAYLKFEDKDKRELKAPYPQEYGKVLYEAATEKDIDVKVNNDPITPTRSWVTTILGLAPSFFIIAILIWLVLGSGLGGLTGNKPVAELPKTRFKDVAGAAEAVDDMKEIVDFLRAAPRFREVGATPPAGALLSGPPGTGKTLLAKAVAGEAGVPFFAASGSDFIEMFVGMGARRVRSLFKEARKHPAAIIFIDEIDAVGGKRSHGSGADDREHSRTINALLSEMDGFSESNVIVLAATNSPDSLDAALVRSGRFDRKIAVDLPDWKGRLGILQIHSKGRPLADDVDLTVLAKTTVGLAGADLANLVNEALINAVREGRDAATHQDFMEALSIVTIGRAKKSSVITDHDKKIVAWHEAGHAIVGMALDEVADPTHITIVPRGFSGGHTKLQESENKFETSRALRGRLAMIMGGMAAERAKLGDITQGPGHDLQAATDLANKMVSKMGMGDTLSIVADQSLLVNSGVSEDVRAKTEELIREGLARAEAVISDPIWGPLFEELSELLLQTDTLESEDIQALKAKANGAKPQNPTQKDSQ